MNLKKLPKVELHCHLDGSIRVETALDLAKSQNIKLPTYDYKELEKLLQVSSECKSLSEYLEKFCIPNKVMQTKESLKRVTYELMKDCAKENIKYIEVRFAPSLHKENNLDTEEIIQSVVDGIKEAEKKYEIKGNIIVSCMRSMSIMEADDVIYKASKFLNDKVVAVDLCAIEEEGFSKKFEKTIEKARNLGYNVTIHAGEGASGQNVLDAVEILKAKRIGHGVRTKDVKMAYEIAKKNNIVFEMCPTSNIQTKAVDSINNHPFYEFYKDNVNVTINTDNRTVSNIDLTNEINVIFDTFKIDYNDYKKIYLNSVEASFANEKTKQWLRSFI